MTEHIQARKGIDFKHMIELIVLCVIGIAVNLALSKLSGAYGLPFYLDAVGTIFAAAVGGTLPGIIVGLATNIMKSVSDWPSIYYGTLNVIDTVYWCPGGIYQTCGNAGVISNYGNLTIDGGRYENRAETQPQGNDYRRCIWSAEGSYTTIKNGTFTSPAQTFCFNGGATIDKGEFQTTGNEAVLSDYCTTDTITINGGTFYNYCNYDGDKDYRRALWATSGSNVVINGGKFNSYYQTLCFNGDFTINGGEFYNPSGDIVLLSSNNVQDGIINGGLFISLSWGETTALPDRLKEQDGSRDGNVE